MKYWCNRKITALFHRIDIIKTSLNQVIVQCSRSSFIQIFIAYVNPLLNDINVTYLHSIHLHWSISRWNLDIQDRLMLELVHFLALSLVNELNPITFFHMEPVSVVILPLRHCCATTGSSELEGTHKDNWVQP